MRVGGLGYDINVRELPGKGGKLWLWSVNHYGKLLSEGSEGTEKAASNAAWAYYREVTTTRAKEGSNKGLARMKLRYMLERRPYLVAGCTDLVLNAKGDLERLMREAEETEKHWWKQDPVDTRVPIPSHHRSLSPFQAATQLWNIFKELKYVDENDNPTVKLRTFARKTFGERYFP